MRQNMISNEGQLILAIKEEQILVAPESRVDIHVGIINQGVNEDYFDIQVNGVPSDWTTIDTPVVHLAAEEAKQITLTIQPPALPQNRVGQYPLDVRAVSQSDPTLAAVAHSVLTVAAYKSEGRIGVALGSVYFSVTPGAGVTIPILLQNQGLMEDVFQLNIEGLPANWISTNAIFTKLEPSRSKEIDFTIRVPRSPEAHVGRTPFKILLISQDFPDQKAEVECILTVGAFWKSSISLEPATLLAGQAGHLVINNEGNTTETYSLNFQNPANELIFEKEVQIAKKESRPGKQEVETAYVEIPPDERIQVEPGAQGIYVFRGRLRSRPIIGNEKTYPFTVKVQSIENVLRELPGEVSAKGIMPPWLAVSLVLGSLVLCLLALIPIFNAQNAVSATQTAAFGQTQVALPGSEQLDTDGDGLINGDELRIGTDPLKADTDGDTLPDGQEVSLYLTNPLEADTDKDSLSDGDEVLKYKTNPLTVDTDADSLNDGDEISRRTDPLNPDTDQDRLSDGIEVQLGTDPTQPDTDKDGLQDGQENQTCPRPLAPDSDNDGILDGKDTDPCNPNNPALTPTVILPAPTQSPQATATIVPPTNIPTGTALPLPTSTAVVPTTTAAAPPSPTPVFPTLQGVMLFASSRDGNSEIYAMNLANQSLLRLTNNAAVDLQPALAPDSSRVAYVSNQNGNNEIYLTGLDRRPPVNLTNNAGDDQQPTWSPDGNWIAFTSNRDGNQEIYVMRSDGSEVHNLTSNAASDFAPAWFSVPRFLGLGTEEWIAFTTNRDGNQEIYRMRPDGTGLTNLTKNPGNDYAPSGFAGGSLLAFVTDRDGNAEIYTMTSNGDSPTNITNHFAQDLDPALDSKGEWIAFSSDRDGNLEIYVVHLADGKVYNVSRNPGQDQYPDW
ncbi:MAG TPA: hypothetical protein VN653_00330 [Anaerolineales bacterium]|nr:hypothetical protein [Anaerolineales bacterium]